MEVLCVKMSELKEHEIIINHCYISTEKYIDLWALMRFGWCWMFWTYWISSICSRQICRVLRRKNIYSTNGWTRFVNQTFSIPSINICLLHILNPPPPGGVGSDPPRFFRNNFFIYYCIDMKLGTPLRASLWRRLVQRKSKSTGIFLL